MNQEFVRQMQLQQIAGGVVSDVYHAMENIHQSTKFKVMASGVADTVVGKINRMIQNSILTSGMAHLDNRFAENLYLFYVEQVTHEGKCMIRLSPALYLLMAKFVEYPFSVLFDVE